MGSAVCHPLAGRGSSTGVALAFLLVALTGASVADAIGAAVPSPASSPLRMTASTTAAVTFTVEDLRTDWRAVEIPDRGLTLFEPRIEGFVSAAEPGGFRTPRAGGWLVVPPGTRPVLRTLREEWRPATGQPLMVETVPAVLPSEPRGDERPTEILVLPGESPPPGVELADGARAALAGRDKAAAQAPVTLGEVTWWRGRRVVPVRIHAVQHDVQGLARQTLVSGEWEVRFETDRAAGRAAGDGPGRKLTGRGDAHFGSLFLNRNLLDITQTESAWRGDADPTRDAFDKAATGKAMALLGPEARLAVTRTGSVRVTYDRLRSQGLIPAGTIDETQLRLYQRRYLGVSGQGSYVEIEVPIHIVGEGNAFDGDDFFVFYGLRLRDDWAFVTDLGQGPVQIPGAGDAYEMHNSANIYWLACAEPDVGQAWERMDTTILPAAAGTPLASYRRSDHIEEQAFFRENNLNTTDDRMYYNWHFDTEVSAIMNPLWAPDPQGADVDLRVNLAGWSGYSGPLKLDLITDQTDTTSLGEYTVSGWGPDTLVTTVPAAALDGAAAKVRAEGLATAGWLLCFLNWVEISYDALYEAVGDRAKFLGGEAIGPQPIEVTGFSTSDVGLFDITDPRRPLFVDLNTANIVPDGAGWKLSIMPDQAGEARVFDATGDFSSDGMPEFVYFHSSVADDPAAPNIAPGGAPDVLVITHADFRDALQRWVDHRVARAGGRLNVHVVDVQDVYDWYSGGLRDPWAVKRLCNYAIDTWGTWSLVVVGDANENELGKRILPPARAWSQDWVPTHYHVQRALSYTPELMASDKWFVSQQAGQVYPVEDFPDVVTGPFDMYSGRLPCNSVDELNILIDKIVAIETPQAGQDWRRRGLFIADDEWSNGYGAEAFLVLEYRFSETVFLNSERDSLADMWANRTGVPLEADLVSLKGLLDPQFPYTPPPPTPEPRPLDTVRDYTAVGATPVLLGELSKGGIVANYQGHANAHVLASEHWLEDYFEIPSYRRDTQLLTNTGKPWFFMGLGCHISDWAQSAVNSASVSREPSISEKMLLLPRAGASALYASSGFEFITANRLLGEVIFRRWTSFPPAQRRVGADSPLDVRSRWVTGELMWAAEADFMATIGTGYPYGEMLTQYVLLGDPLMTLDGGEPVVTATLVGDPDQEISGTIELAALDESNLRTVRVSARDEAGIDRLEVVDDQGTDLTAQVVVETLPAGAVTHQLVDYELTLPIRPYDHTLTVRVFDTGAPLPEDRHWDLTLDLTQTAEFTVDGEVIDPETFSLAVGVTKSVQGAVTCPAWLTNETEFGLTSETLTLTGVTFNLAKGRGLTVDFDATALVPGDTQGHSVVLTIDGLATELVLQAGPGEAAVDGIGRVFSYPNPMVTSTRFVFESGFSGGAGGIRVFSVAGRQVARLEFDHVGGDNIVTWDGRDARGDELANGTYLYRIEVDGPQGLTTSDMQRLVIMR